MRPGKAIRRLVSGAPAVFASLPLKRHRCIFATAVGIEALREVGVSAVPLSVRMVALNAAMRRWLESGLAGGEAEGRRLGAFMVETDVSGVAEPGAWCGHLVLHVPASGVLVDLDLGQASRPERGLVLPPAVAFPWLSGASRNWQASEDGTVLGYEARDDAGWRVAPDWWRRDAFFRDAVGAVVRAVRAGGS